MSNTDIAFKDSNFIDNLLTNNYPKDVACIGPSICVNEFKSYDNPVAYRRRTICEINRLIKNFLFLYLMNFMFGLLLLNLDLSRERKISSWKSL